MEKKMPTYKIVVNPEDETTGVFAVSLVDDPAIEVDWIKLSKIIEIEFSANKDKQMLFGPLLIPNKMIYRKDNNGNEYNIYFDEETIQTIADKYNENKINDVFNFQHSDKKVEAILLQNWITGEVDKSQEFGFALPKGTWFGGIKVKDENFWNEFVKTEKVKGFSVEIMAGTELVEMTTQVDKNKINFMTIKTNEGVSLFYDGELSEGTIIFIDEAMTELAPEGAHMLEDGTVVTLDDKGAILSIATETPEIDEPATDEDLAEPETPEAPAPEAPAFDIEGALNELRTVISELATRVDALENVETTEEEANDDENEMLSKVKDLEDKVEMLSNMAGTKSINKKDDRDIAIEDKQKAMLDRIEFLKNR
jgi:hypothetical protein